MEALDEGRRTADGRLGIPVFDLLEPEEQHVGVLVSGPQNALVCYGCVR